MDQIRLAVELDLALHLGLIGTALSLAVWRLAHGREVIERAQLLQHLEERGFAPRAVRISRLLSLSELGAKAAGVTGVIVLIMNGFLFFQLTDKMVGGRSRFIDSGLFERLRIDSEYATQRGVDIAAVVAAVFLLDYAFSLLAAAAVVRHELPARFHAHVVPRDWKQAPEAMWEDRIEETARFLDPPFRGELNEIRSSGRWRDDWNAWAKAVAGYRLLGAYHSDFGAADREVPPGDRVRTVSEPVGG